MSALAPIPQDCVTQGDVTPAMRQWMVNVLIDAIGFDNALVSRAPANVIIDGVGQVAQGGSVALTVAPQFGPDRKSVV